MSRKYTLSLLSIATLALAGCTSGGSSSTPAPTVTVTQTPTTASPLPTVTVTATPTSPSSSPSESNAAESATSASPTASSSASSSALPSQTSNPSTQPLSGKKITLGSNVAAVTVPTGWNLGGIKTDGFGAGSSDGLGGLRVLSNEPARAGWGDAAKPGPDNIVVELNRVPAPNVKGAEIVTQAFYSTNSPTMLVSVQLVAPGETAAPIFYNNGMAQLIVEYWADAPAINVATEDDVRDSARRFMMTKAAQQGRAAVESTTFLSGNSIYVQK